MSCKCVYVIACVCVSLTVGSLSTEEKNAPSSDSSSVVSESSVVSNSLQTNNTTQTHCSLNVNITTELSGCNNWTEENGFINSVEIDNSLYNVKDVTNCTENLLDSANLSSFNENITKPSDFTNDFELTNFTGSSDIFKDFQSYNSSDLSDFIDRFQMPNFTELDLQSNNLDESSNFTRLSDIFKDFQSYNNSDLSDFIGKFQMPNFTELDLQSNNVVESSNFTRLSDIFKDFQSYNNSDLNDFIGKFQMPNFTELDLQSNNVDESSNFTRLSDIFKDFQSYNNSDLNDFIGKFQMPNFTELDLQSNNVDESSNFTESFQLTNTSHMTVMENVTQAQNLGNTTLYSYDEHIVVKRESDASFQKEYNDFDEEIMLNETTESTTIAEIETTVDELTTTEEPTVYPYTSKDGLIDVVADNGIKYISSESDDFPRSGEETENLAGITDDSEPMHYVISGESDLSQDSRKAIGIEDLLPDFVKPTVSGESANNDAEAVAEETPKSSEEIVLSESEEEPSTTTTTEPVTWLVNSREYKGENYESKEDTKPHNVTVPLNQTELEEDTSLNMEYRDEEENQIQKNFNASNNNVGSYSTSTLSTKHYAGQTSTLKTNEQEESNASENITSAENESNEDSEYDPWGNDGQSHEENKSVIENSIDSDETHKKGEQFELVEMSFGSSSDNSTNFSLESDQIANENFTFQNIELSSSESYDESKKSSGDVSREDYDVDNNQILNTDNANLTNQNSKDVFTDSNIEEKLNERRNHSRVQSNKTTTSIHLKNLNTKNENGTKSNSTNITTHLFKKNILNSTNGRNVHSNKINFLNFTKENQEKIKLTTKPKESDMYKVEPDFNKSDTNVRRRRGIFKNMEMIGKDFGRLRNMLAKERNMSHVEHTTPYHWPQNSRENHGDLFETQEENDTAKSEDFDYFHASVSHYSDYDEYSGKDISIHVIDRNTSDGVKIFITKKNNSRADVQKDYEDFMDEFKVNSTADPEQSEKQYDEESKEQPNRRHRRDAEDNLLEKYKRFLKQKSKPKKHLVYKISPTQMDLEKMLSKLFMYKLRNSFRKTMYFAKAKSKIIFKGQNTEENGTGKQLESQTTNRKFTKSKQEAKKKFTFHKIKTNFTKGIYKWSKKLNRLKKIDR